MHCFPAIFRIPPEHQKVRETEKTVKTVLW